MLSKLIQSPVAAAWMASPSPSPSPSLSLTLSLSLLSMVLVITLIQNYILVFYLSVRGEFGLIKEASVTIVTEDSRCRSIQRAQLTIVIMFVFLCHMLFGAWSTSSVVGLMQRSPVYVLACVCSFQVS